MQSAATLNPKLVRQAKAKLARDPALANLFARVGPFRLQANRQREPFEALLRAIVYQLLSTAAATTIYGRAQALVGERPTPTSVLACSRQQLRGVGLSWAKVDALRDLAQKRQQGLVPTRRQAEAMSDAELIERLTAIRGIGRWTVEMLLIFSLGRADVLPVADLGIRRGYQLTYGKRREPQQKNLRKIGEAWAPYRSVVSWYLWRANDIDWSGG